MPDIASVSAILSSVKTATEIAKMLKDSDLSFDKAETKLKLAELVSSLADAKLEAAQLQELLLEKDKIIKDLQYAQSLKSKLIWKEPVYWLNENGKEDGPFCPQCYDANQKLIRLQTYDKEHWHCLTCDKSFFGKNYNP